MKDRVVLTREEKTQKNNAIRLALLCMLVYAVAYLGRKSYDSNINEIMGFFGVEKPVAGLIGTCFFVSYGIGQVFHGIMCKKYNPKWSIFVALVFSIFSNTLVGIMPQEGFKFVKYLWVINGFSQATLWSSIILLLNSATSRKYLGTVLFLMCLPVSTGTFLTYGFSALYSYLGNFKLSFIGAGILMAIMAVYWLIRVDTLTIICKKDKAVLDTEAVQEEVKNSDGNFKSLKGFIVLFSVMAVLAILNNLIKDGVTTWTPTLLKEYYGLENWLSVLLTVALPLFAVAGAIITVRLSKIVKNYIALLCLLFFVAFLAMLILVLCFNTNIWLITLCCFMITCLLMSGINGLITNVFPLQSGGKKINAGLVAGLIDGFCYLGSAISSFGLGSLAHNYGWLFSMKFVMFICLFAVCICAIKLFITAILRKNAK